MESEMNLDQAVKADNGKMHPTLLFKGVPQALEAVVNVFDYGAEKYEAHSWKAVDPERYEEALLRHTIAWQGGEERDPESGILHLAHMTWNCLTLLQSYIEDMNRDNIGQKPWVGYNNPPVAHREKVNG